MTDSLDKRIAALERDLAALRRQKLEELQSQMQTLQASIGGMTTGAAPSHRGRPSRAGTGWAAELQEAPASGSPKKRRGRKRGRQIPEEEALAALKRVVQSAGKEGISARQASQQSGIFYPRAIKLMDEHFKKSGSGKWTRYTV
jgi:hypothetical protein